MDWVAFASHMGRGERETQQEGAAEKKNSVL